MDLKKEEEEEKNTPNDNKRKVYVQFMFTHWSSFDTSQLNWKNTWNGSFWTSIGVVRCVQDTSA